MNVKDESGENSTETKGEEANPDEGDPASWQEIVERWNG